MIFETDTEKLIRIENKLNNISDFLSLMEQRIDDLDKKFDLVVSKDMINEREIKIECQD